MKEAIQKGEVSCLSISLSSIVSLRYLTIHMYPCNMFIRAYYQYIYLAVHILNIVAYSVVRSDL